MSQVRSVVAVDFGFGGGTDVSRKGHAVRRVGMVDADRRNGRLTMSGPGALEIESSPELRSLQTFTLEMALSVDELGSPQQVLVGEALPVSIRLDKDGTVVAAVRTEQGWEGVDSGSSKLATKTEARLRLILDDKRQLRLELDDHAVGVMSIKGALARAGTGGILIGSKGAPAKGTQAFRGSLGRLRIRNGAIDAAGLAVREKRAQDLAARIKSHLKFPGKVRVQPDPDAVDHRFDVIKGILAAAGVSDVSELSRLSITSRTVVHPNTLMVAPRKSLVTAVDWGAIATTIASADAASAVRTTASVLPNRHSRAILAMPEAEAPVKRTSDFFSKGTLEAEAAVDAKMSMAVGADYRAQPGPLTESMPTVALRKEAMGAAAPILAYEGAVRSHVALPTSSTKASSGRVSTAKSTNGKVDSPLGTKATAALLDRRIIGELVRPARGVEILDPGLFDAFDDERPEAWPSHQLPHHVLASITSIPVNASVIIAGVLDLTNQELVIEPSVETLYIIAEEIVGSPNASITWRRPGGSTPARADAPDKNGQSWSGVHTAENSRNGLRGGDGIDGEPGQLAADGIDAPNLEIWAKALTAMPDIDLNGENGIKGGRGQRGGRGGNGAIGAGGEWWWFFGVHCWKSPGHGGNGGAGGDGGRGGAGGDGGRGGNIAIGVLEGTLASSVTARAFKVKNQGGQEGRGGDGGSGGAGGQGGRHGNDWVDGELVCGDGVNGTNGAQGQPGAIGAEGRLGQDGTLNFFEFTEESWNEQLTRPWLYELSPVQVFPGGTLSVTGTRFADTDRVIIDGFTLVPTIAADESLTVTIPTTITGGEKDVLVRRFDGDESNRLRLWVKPQLDALAVAPVRGAQTRLTGLAFVAGAQVLYNGAVVPADSVTRTELRFTVPAAGAGVTGEETVSLAVRNPDGLVSNTRSVALPRTIESGLKVDVHGLSFVNFTTGAPSWGTFEQTFGTFEVWHELLDPLFGHPILTTAYYIFYEHFLKGTGGGGLATGFCTSMSAKVLDEFWTGSTDTFTRISLTDAVRTELTAIHGRLLSRESLLDFHDQGRAGTANAATCFRRIEASLRDGADRESSLMLFFVPSGEVWDAGYFDKLSSSHCIVPYRIVYPVGHDGTSIAGCTMFCWDCNHPFSPGDAAAGNCRLVFRETDGEIRYDYFDGGSGVQFCSEDGVTLATMSNGKYLLSDHDLPFSGPLGLTTFVIDFLLSPADLVVENSVGQRTGLVGASILAEIPDSHPCFLVKGAYMLPANEALTRRIVGNGAGSYAYHSIAPNGVSVSLEGVPTAPGQVDVLAANADGTILRFTPGAAKNFTLNLAREVAGQARAVTIRGVGGGPMTAMDLTLSPDLSVVRVSNTDTERAVDVQVGHVVKETGASAKLNRNAVPLPTDNDLVVTVTDWQDLNLTVRALPFA